MLVLTRRAGESTHIGDSIEVIVLDILGEAGPTGIYRPEASKGASP